MRLLLWFLLFLFSAGNAMEQNFRIHRFENKLDIAQLLQLHDTLFLSPTPKKLSSLPQATCFTVNINDYLTKSSFTKPIYGCIFSDQVTMNAALLRAGLYIHTKSGMASDEQVFNSPLMTTVGGHDFNGLELYQYKKHCKIPAATQPQYQTFKAIEHEFDQEIILPIINNHRDNFIFFAIINTQKFKENLSHELLHAQYYNTSEIQPILLKLWQEAPDTDRKIIISALQQGGYDTDKQELLLREFYSYFMQYNAKQYLMNNKTLSPMAALAEKYAAKISKALTEAHIRVLTVN